MRKRKIKDKPEIYEICDKCKFLKSDCKTEYGLFEITLCSECRKQWGVISKDLRKDIWIHILLFLFALLLIAMWCAPLWVYISNGMSTIGPYHHKWAFGLSFIITIMGFWLQAIFLDWDKHNAW